MSITKKLTIFTPTYNRVDRLRRAYESLKRQTEGDFVWLIVDDGSTDGTEDLVRGFIDEGLVDIKYLQQKNGGKMRAHNRGVMECDTELFVCLDSDDYLTETAVGDILEAWSEVGADSRYAGIIAYKGESVGCPESNGEVGARAAYSVKAGGGLRPIYGNYFPSDDDSSFRELYQRGFKGETTLVFRSKLLKENLFPEIEGEKYVPEDVVYDRVDEGHIFKVLPRILTVCELVDEGYTDRVEELRRQAPTGWFIYYYQRAVAWPWSVTKIKFASHYLRFMGLVEERYKKEYRLPIWMMAMGVPGWLGLSIKRKL